MKKLIALVMMFMLCLTSSVSLAAGSTFNPKELIDEAGFEYDNADGSWNYDLCAYQGTRGLGFVGLYARGKNSTVDGVLLWGRCLAPEAGMVDIDSMQILVADRLYTCQLSNLGKDGFVTAITPAVIQILEDFAEADSMTVKYEWSTGSTTMEFGEREMVGLNSAAETILRTRMVERVSSSSMEWLANDYPITVE